MFQAEKDPRVDRERLRADLEQENRERKTEDLLPGGYIVIKDNETLFIGQNPQSSSPRPGESTRLIRLPDVSTFISGTHLRVEYRGERGRELWLVNESNTNPIQVKKPNDIPYESQKDRTNKGFPVPMFTGSAEKLVNGTEVILPDGTNLVFFGINNTWSLIRPNTVSKV